MRPGWMARLGIGLCLSGALVAAPPAGAASSTGAAASTTRGLADLAACDDRAPQDRASCRREAAAAWDEARRGQLDDGSAQQHQANALARCERLPAEERSACIARMQGGGTVRGSAAEGGIYREMIIREDAPVQDGAKR